MSRLDEIKNDKDKMKGYFLLLTSNYKTQLVEGIIKDGAAYVGDKDFIVDGTEPFLFKEDSMFGSSYYPFYIVKWDDPNPKTLTDIKNLDELDVDSHELNPKMLRKLGETRLLEGLFKHGSDELISSDTKRKVIIVLTIIMIIAVGLYYYLFVAPNM